MSGVNNPGALPIWLVVMNTSAFLMAFGLTGPVFQGSTFQREAPFCCGRSYHLIAAIVERDACSAPNHIKL
jgi:hypothetical protein